MGASGFFRFDALPPRTAHGYVETDGTWHTNAHLLPVVGGPDGGAFTTVTDVERLWRALCAQGRLLSPAPHPDLPALPTVRVSPTQAHGYGVWIREPEGPAPVVYRHRRRRRRVLPVELPR